LRMLPVLQRLGDAYGFQLSNTFYTGETRIFKFGVASSYRQCV